MDVKQAIGVIRQLAPELHANDGGHHVNVSRYPGGPIHSIMPPQSSEAAPLRWEDEVEHIRRGIADADRMLPAMPVDEGEDEEDDEEAEDDVELDVVRYKVMPRAPPKHKPPPKAARKAKHAKKKAKKAKKK